MNDTPNEPPRREITLDELDQGIEKHGPQVMMSLIEVKGIVTVFDKDGDVKSTMEVVSLEPDEEI